MRKKRLNLICILSVAGILLLLALFAVNRQKMARAREPIVIGQAVIDVIDINAIEVTPEPTAAPILPQNAVTVLVDRRPVLTLASGAEAQRLLWEYLEACAVAPEGEVFVSANFAREIIIGPMDANATIMDYAAAWTLLMEAPALVPVRLVTNRVSSTTADIAVNNLEEPALYKGTRIVKQVGAGAVTVSTVTAEYIAGEEVQAGEPVVTTAVEGRATIVKTGTYTRRDLTGMPEKGEGVHGKAAGALTLTYPMRGSVKLRFGINEGRMHNGIDIENIAGTKVSAPGEGVVVYCGERGAYGYTVDIDHDNGFVSRLTHLQEPTVELNQRVFAGDVIGTLAPLENSRNKPHLHYELIVDNVPYNPEFYIK